MHTQALGGRGENYYSGCEALKGLLYNENFLPTSYSTHIGCTLIVVGAMVKAAMLFARLALNQLSSLLCAFVVTVGGFSYGPVDARSAPGGALRNITYGELVCTHLAPGQFTDLSQPQAGNGGYIVNATELIDVLGGSYAPGQRYRGQSYNFFLCVSKCAACKDSTC